MVIITCRNPRESPIKWYAETGDLWWSGWPVLDPIYWPLFGSSNDPIYDPEMDPFIDPVLVPFIDPFLDTIIDPFLGPRMTPFMTSFMDPFIGPRRTSLLVSILYNIIHPTVRSASGAVCRDGRDVVSLLPNRTHTLWVAGRGTEWLSKERGRSPHDLNPSTPTAADRMDAVPLHVSTCWCYPSNTTSYL